VTPAWLLGLAVVVAGLAVAAYRTARARYRAHVPAALLDELVRHKVECRHEPAARVTLELRLLLGTAPPATVASLLRPLAECAPGARHASERGVPLRSR
jgi:hypothetical protein